jgi:8-oxo-dGTP pyrophosphatase MutT (NUDIX family)
MQQNLDKVTAFITREGAAGRELLVFAHENPAAGVQVPAGTVEPGEPPAQAVLREAWEETGLPALRIVRPLGLLIEDLPAGIYALIGATPFLQAPDPHAPPQDLGFGRGAILGRGGYVTLAQVAGEWARVTHEDHDPASDPPYQPVRTTGWVPAARLAPRLTRHLFHLVSLEPAPAAWTALAEGRYRFHFSWVPLTPRPHLIGPQDRWLVRVYTDLL